MLLVIYLPVLLGALSDPRIGVQLEGINYFADTLLFAGTILTLASASRYSLPSVFIGAPDAACRAGT